MKLVVGLGNPGEEYRGTRHNLGFMVVEELARRHRVHKQEYKHKAVLAWIQYKGEMVVLAKPLTYMNLSGMAVKPLVSSLKVGPGELLVIYDDMDLELGRIRIRPGGGSGGHRGLISIIGSLGTGEFHRLRIGIGRPPEGEEVIDHVLSRFDRGEEIIIKAAIDKASDAVQEWIREGIVKAMNSYN